MLATGPPLSAAQQVAGVVLRKMNAVLNSTSSTRPLICARRLAVGTEHARLTSQRLNVWCAKSAYASPTSTSARPKLRTVPTDRVQGHIVTRNTSGPLQQSRTAARRPLVTRKNGHFQSRLRASASRTVGRTAQARMLREPRSPQRMKISPRRAAYVL